MAKHELIIYAKQKDPPLASLILAEMATNLSVSVQWCDETYINVNGIKLNTDASICRYISRLSPTSKLYGSTLTESVEVDHWISFSIGKLEQTVDLFESFNYLNSELVTVTYLVGHSITIADVYLWSVLYRNQKCKELLKKHPKFKNVIRWYLFIESQSNVKKILKQVMDTELCSENLEPIPPKTVKRKAEGKFIELPEAEMGKVVVRFPPEASGYLHIGHAKAALLNQYYRDAFKGKLIMRFDDTNPAKEKVDFEKVILEDLSLLKINYDVFSHTSDYFDVMLEYCEKLIVDGKAYVDDTNAELMKQEREQKIESKNRNNDVHKNLAMWSEMKKGSPYGQECCVRAKIDMSSVNGCMRDPTIYRCKNEPHPRTGSKYKVYPTYDFACPIVDSLEGVTHCLRTTEYHDRDEQFYWFIDQLGLRKPYIWEYSRLNMTNTVLSKRKLTWFVDEGLVDGWDDPRLPTVRGILRRGLTVEALKEFIVAQGSSRSVVLMQWDKIWAINKKIIDPIAPRYTAVENDRRVIVNIKNVEEHSDKVKLHPKNSGAGEKTIWKGPRIFIDQADAALMTEGQTITFVSWGNIKIVKINRFQGHVVDIDAELNLSDTNYKDTMKVTWIADRPDVMPVVCVYFDHIISKANLAKDEDFKDYVNSSTRNEVFMIGEPELRNIKKSEIIQLVRKGFFICDSPYAPCSPYTSCESPLILFNIPDGHTKESPTSEPVNKELSKKELSVSKENIVVKKFSPVELNKKFKEITGDEFLNENELNSSVTGKNYEEKLHDSVLKQANKVRELKANNSDKKLISEQVRSLLSLKQLYKDYTGKDWLAQQTPSSSIEMSNTEEQKSKASSLLEMIEIQGNNVRNLKASKAEKSIIDAEVKKLLALKADYKSLTGEDWKPSAKSIPTTKTDSSAPPSKTKNTDNSVPALSEAITQQGNRVRNLKAAKEAKAVIEEEVKKLLALKAEYKTATGQDWKPSSVTTPEIAPVKSSLKNVTPTNLQPSSVENRETDSSAEKLSTAITEQGNRVRSLKAAKEAKAVIDEEVKKLLALKAEYKTLTNQDWKPPTEPTPSTKNCGSSTKSPAQSVKSVSTDKIILCSNAIIDPNNMVSTLNTSAENVEMSTNLLPQKKEKCLSTDKVVYKQISGIEWSQSNIENLLNKSSSTAVVANIEGNYLSLSENLADRTVDSSKRRTFRSNYTQTPISSDGVAVNKEPNDPVQDTGNNEGIRRVEQTSEGENRDTTHTGRACDLETSPISNVSIMSENLRKQTDTASDVENDPCECATRDVDDVFVVSYSERAVQLANDIVAQSEIIANLRQRNSSPELLEESMVRVFALKCKFRELTGKEWLPNIRFVTKNESKNRTSLHMSDFNKQSEICKKSAKVQEPQGTAKKQTRLGLEAKKEENLPDWYSQVITKGELIEYYDVSGCYILRPWAYSIWEAIQSWFDSQIKELGVQNCYFPIFVSKNALEKEKTHIADFSPEVAWVTKSGDSDLAEPIAIRPTSETVMYPAYAKWVQSHRDLPIKLNQWNNVVRWEFKHPQPFLRTREFLWQEGHTAFATQKEAEEEVFVILDLYAKIYTDLLAIPVIKGRKTEKEKFAGGDFTTTVEAFIAASGRGIQGATSHHLGQNFSKMFNITFEDPETLDKNFVYQNSWGLTTRTIGVMIMVHSDNQGLVLPPRVAAVQVVIVPCGVGASTKDEDRKLLYDSCYELEAELKSAGIKVKGDYRDNYSPGWKFNHWELKGVPIRIELGPKDIKEKQLVAVRRDLGTKITLKRDHTTDCIKNMLDEIHNYLYEKAKSEFDSHTIICHKWQEFTPTLDQKNVILAPFCMESSCEDLIKQDSARDENAEPGALSSGAKSLCIPFEQPNGGVKDGTKCIHPSCNNLAKYYTLFGRSY